MKTLKELKTEAREIRLANTILQGAAQDRAYADWAERIQRDAVAEERKALREIVFWEMRDVSKPRARILAALDARSKP